MRPGRRQERADRVHVGRVLVDPARLAPRRAVRAEHAVRVPEERGALGLQRAAQRLVGSTAQRRRLGWFAAHAGGGAARRSTARAAATRRARAGPAAQPRVRVEHRAGWCRVAAADDKDGNASGGGRGGERRRWRRGLRRFRVHHPSHRRKIGNCAATRRRLPLEPRRDAVVAARGAAAAQTAEPGAILAGVVDFDAARVPRDLAALAARRPEARPTCEASVHRAADATCDLGGLPAAAAASSPHARPPRGDAIARSLPLPLPPSVNCRRTCPSKQDR